MLKRVKLIHILLGGYGDTRVLGGEESTVLVPGNRWPRKNFIRHLQHPDFNFLQHSDFNLLQHPDFTLLQHPNFTFFPLSALRKLGKNIHPCLVMISGGLVHLRCCGGGCITRCCCCCCRCCSDGLLRFLGGSFCGHPTRLGFLCRLLLGSLCLDPHASMILHDLHSSWRSITVSSHLDQW